MKSNVGLWIDHRRAVVVRITDKGEQIKQVSSNVEKRVKYKGDLAEGGPGEDIRDRQYQNHLNDYYDRVIADLNGDDSVFVFGPGEAKHQLETRLEKVGLRGCIVAVESMDKLTDRQIVAKVRQYFEK